MTVNCKGKKRHHKVPFLFWPSYKQLVGFRFLAARTDMFVHEA